MLKWWVKGIESSKGSNKGGINEYEHVVGIKSNEMNAYVISTHDIAKCSLKQEIKQVLESNSFSGISHNRKNN